MDDKKIKHDDKLNSPYRSGRFYLVSNQWYFSVREQDDQGPFNSKQSAEDSLKLYLLAITHFNSNENISDFGIN